MNQNKCDRDHVPVYRGVCVGGPFNGKVIVFGHPKVGLTYYEHDEVWAPAINPCGANFHLYRHYDIGGVGFWYGGELAGLAKHMASIASTNFYEKIEVSETVETTSSPVVNEVLRVAALASVSDRLVGKLLKFVTVDVQAGDGANAPSKLTMSILVARSK